GMYSAQDGKLTIRLNGKQAWHWQLAFAKDDLELDGLVAQRVPAFKAGSKLAGTFAGTNRGVGGTSRAAAARTYAFDADGSYRLETGSATDTFATEGKSQGTYSLAGNTLKLRSADGKSVALTIFPYTDQAGRIQLNIDGAFCNKKE